MIYWPNTYETIPWILILFTTYIQLYFIKVGEKSQNIAIKKKLRISFKNNSIAHWAANFFLTTCADHIEQTEKITTASCKCPVSYSAGYVQVEKLTYKCPKNENFSIIDNPTVLEILLYRDLFPKSSQSYKCFSMS